MSWTQKTLGEIVNLKRGFDLPSSNRVDGPYPVFSSSGQTGTHSEAAVKGPCVITGRYGTIGQVFYSDAACWPLNTSLYSTEFKGNDPKYVYYLLKTLPWRDYLTASAVPGINRNHVHLCPVCVPDYETQTAISGVLGLLDNKIELNTKLNGYLAEIADALFTDAFGNLEDNAVLSDIAKITMGQSPAGTSYNEEGVGTVFYQGRGEFGWRYPTQRLFTTEPKRMAKSGDVLMSVRAPVGDLNLAYEDCCIGRGLVAISCDYPSYCLYLMRSLGKKLDAYNGEGTVFGSISGKALKGIGIGLPGNDDIAAFEAMVAPIDAQIRCNETESRILSQLRDALLPKLMSGEIGVSKVDLTRLNSHLA